LLEKISPAFDDCMIFLYVNDVVVFVKTSEQDLAITDYIFQVFANASGLITNMQKTHIYPVGYDGGNLNFILNTGRSISSLPYTYLGLPLGVRNHPKQCYCPYFRKLEINYQDGKGIFYLILEESFWLSPCSPQCPHTLCLPSNFLNG
jgi:hypothetical protein